jgi:GTP-binding protein HflX
LTEDIKRNGHDKRQRTPQDTMRPAMAAAVISPYDSHSRGTDIRDSDAKLEEAVGLARAIDLDVRLAATAPLRRVTPATLIGKGVVERVKAAVEEQGIGLVIVDDKLTPVQQRNLEKAWNAKVIDRTGLILEIFGARAQTHEGRLQVELAALDYQRGRLVRSWTHLERQRGGFGFLGGPGETQLEADRRLIEERIARLEAELDKVKRTRKLHRLSRQRVPYPIVALVGYTNAGKSTLFNRLSRAKVMASDMLFATLDPTLRAVDLPHGARVILSDTVGFISDLPTMLVAAFRATLEEVVEADVILHVRDISHVDADAQSSDVQEILHQLGIEVADGEGAAKLIEVWNKVDRLDEEGRATLHNVAQRQPAGRRPVLISALSGQGLDELTLEIETRIAATRVVLDLDLDSSDGAGISWLHRNAEILSKEFSPEGRLAVTVRVDPVNAGKVRAKFCAPEPTDDGSLS